MHNFFSDFEEYKFILKRYKNNKNNFYYLPNDIKKFIEEKRISYFEYVAQLFLILDQGMYDDLFYFSNDFNIEEIPLKKDTCVTIIDRNGYNLQNILQIEKKIIRNGAEKIACDYGVSLDLSKYRDIISEFHKKDIEYLETLGLRLVSGRDDEFVQQVHELWRNGLPSYHVPFEHVNYMHHPDHNVICLIDNTSTVAGVYWACDANRNREYRHIVISPAFRRRGLGSIMLRHAIYDAIANDIKSMRTWIAEDNTNSLSMHNAVGFKRNGLIAYQYLFKSP